MDIVTFLGRMHPLVVHLPIGFLLLAGIFYYLGKREKYASLHKALPVTFFLSALSAVSAAFFGWLLAANSEYEEGTLFWHKYLGIAVVVFSALGFWLSLGEKKIPAWVVLTTIVLLSITGHLGGSLTHGEDYLLEPLRSEKAKEEIVLPKEIDSIVVYTHLVQPVLEKKCYACHNNTKQNGGLNMATWQGMEKGGNSGKVMAQEAFKSELFKRVTLAQNSKKFMPPKGEPLTFHELNVLKWWLENGAQPKAKLNAFKLTEEIKETLLYEYNLDTHPKPFVETIEVEKLPEVIFSELEQNGWRINVLAQSNNLIEVSPEYNTQLTKKKILSLLKAKNHITWLNLGKSTITDEDLKIIAQFPNLSRLRIEETQISDAGLEHLIVLQHLESLNLFNNNITDTGLGLLQKMPALKKVYLWNTKTTEEGKLALKSKKPDLQLL